MNASTLPLGSRASTADAAPAAPDTARVHSICWGAVLAGAAGAASLALILLMLGVGLGLSSVSPWSSEGVSAETFGVASILWLTFMQLAASGLGGYLAGRLRQRWSRVHADEVYFRDTAHGFLAWSVAALASAGLMTGAASAILSGGAKVGAMVSGTVAPAAAVVASAGGINPDYFVDTLFRRPLAGAGTGAAPSPSTPDTPPTAEVTRIFASAAGAPALPVDDAQYLAQLVAQRTSLSPQEAQTRVTDTFARLQAQMAAAREQAKASADKARRASAKVALWGFISLLIGAFVASYLGTLGGRHRDQF
ncbi:hypothetical protein [Pelomonas sp. BJYL3]|uniref:hypothetical protein n=1 Tax=Pelomonas sp. BJYL3 TaxID=2976697 RepID=UPI0022B4692F|nr:hypothetical protein [Pelomonas sp. BJYL3]